MDTEPTSESVDNSPISSEDLAKQLSSEMQAQMAEQAKPAKKVVAKKAAEPVVETEEAEVPTEENLDEVGTSDETTTEEVTDEGTTEEETTTEEAPETEISKLRKEIEELKKAKNEPTKQEPAEKEVDIESLSNFDRVDHVNDSTSFEAERARALATKKTCLRYPDGFKTPDGKIVTKEAVRETLAEMEEILTERLPKRGQFLQTRDAITAEIRKKNPDMYDLNTPVGQWASAVRKGEKWLATTPNADDILHHYWVGLQTEAAKSKTAKPAVKNTKPVVDLKPTNKVAPGRSTVKAKDNKTESLTSKKTLTSAEAAKLIRSMSN